MTAIYVTVDYCGAKSTSERLLCQGCTPALIDGQSAPAAPTRAEYQIVGASGTIALCRACAIHSIKSLAARFMLFDPSATRDLMSFFAVEAAKKSSSRQPVEKRPTPRKKPSSRPSLGKPSSRPSEKRRSPQRVLDVVAPLLLEGESAGRKKG